VRWNRDGASYTTAMDFSYTVDAAHTFTAVFQLIPTYTITVNTSPSGLDYPYGGGTYYAGNVAYIGVSAVSGYNFVRWNRDGSSYTTSMSFSYTIDASHTFTAVFQLIPTYTITVNTSPAGLDYPYGGGTYYAGNVANIGVSNVNCYNFVRWNRDGASYTTAMDFSYTVDASHTFTAVFSVIPTYSLTVSAGSGGTVSGTSSGSYCTGTSISVTANPNSGYQFSSWSGSGYSCGTNNPCSFPMPASAVTLTAVFQQIPTYSFTVSAGSGGTVSGTPSGSYPAGTSISVTANPNSGYQFSSWSGSGYSCGTNNPCSFSMPANAVTLTANFTPQPNLVITSFTVPDGNPGAAGTASVTVTNNGGQSTGVSFEVGFHDGSPAIASIDCTNEETGVVTAALVAGSSVNVSIPFTYPAVGTYTARIMADSDCQVTESNESDNAASDTYTSTSPQPPGNVSGWAWSENIGWISFNCNNPELPTPRCTNNYGVNINLSTGVFSGYAWSEHIGWISFNESELTGCPTAPCQAKFNFSTKQVSGWAKALTDGGGWDGWIRLRDTNYGVSWNSSTAEMEGWAWSDQVIGWISFNCKNQNVCGTSNYKVIYGVANKPPTAAISCDASGCQPGGQCNANWIAYNRNCIYLILNQSTDPDNNIKKSIWSIFYQDGTPWQDPFVTCNDDPVTPGNEAICNLTLPTLTAGQSYSVKLYVEDTGGLSDSTTHNFYVRLEAVAAFECSLKPSEGWKSCNFGVSEDVLVYFRSVDGTRLSRPSEGASSITSFSWTFEDGIPSSSTQQNPSAKFKKVDANSGLVTLKITDNVGRTDTEDHKLLITIPMPEWWEVPPF
jgi:uncharacterized repeat protein (TIGR02543 family)